MIKAFFPNLAVVLLLIGLSACGSGTAPIAATATTQAVATATATPLPSNTPTPTNTLIPTNTPMPTNTPTITPTPGPFSYTDDFSSQNQEAWPFCDACEWKDGQLILGPYDPGSNAGENLNYVICSTCGLRTYYRMSVDVTFVDGQVDRYFGTVAPAISDGFQWKQIYYYGLSPWQFYIVRNYDYEKGLASNLKSSQSSLINASTQTNRLTIETKPSGKQGKMDVYYSMNGKTVYVISGIDAEPSMVGLGMSFHSTTVAYDNFEYLETAP